MSSMGVAKRGRALRVFVLNRIGWAVLIDVSTHWECELDTCYSSLSECNPGRTYVEPFAS